MPQHPVPDVAMPAVDQRRAETSDDGRPSMAEAMDGHEER